MKTLKEHDSERQHVFGQNRFPQPNGIACDKCGEELMDTDSTLLMSNPPKKNVHCPKCGFTGYRLA